MSKTYHIYIIVEDKKNLANGICELEFCTSLFFFSFLFLRKKDGI